jgi:hypothetical protein
MSRGVKRSGDDSSSEKNKRNKDEKIMQERADNSILEDIKCPVCQEPPKDVTTTPCGKVTPSSNDNSYGAHQDITFVHFVYNDLEIQATSVRFVGSLWVSGTSLLLSSKVVHILSSCFSSLFVSYKWSMKCTSAALIKPYFGLTVPLQVNSNLSSSLTSGSPELILH